MKMNHALVVAEAGVNHNGELPLALRLVDVAAAAGANAIKFQSFRAEDIVLRDAPKAEYQRQTTGAAETQYDMLKRLEIDRDFHLAVFEHCRTREISFLSTPFDHASLEFLTGELGLAQVKIPSGEITNAPLVLAGSRRAKDVILSTGMSTLSDVENALGIIAFGLLGGDGPCPRAFAAAYSSPEGRQALAERVTLLHCTTEYPAPFEGVNLNAMTTLSRAFGLRVGLSDHSSGISVPLAAVALGACMIEKHLTLDRSLPGPDHKASLEPGDFAAMVKAIREVEQALGDGIKRPMPCEVKNALVARRSLVARRPIRKGETFSETNLAVMRPGSGVSPMHYWDLLGRTAGRDYAAGELMAAPYLERDA